MADLKLGTRCSAAIMMWKSTLEFWELSEAETSDCCLLPGKIVASHLCCSCSTTVEQFTSYHDSFWLHSCSHGAGCLRRLGGRLDLGFCRGAVAPPGHNVGHLPWHIHGHGIWISSTPHISDAQTLLISGFCLLQLLVWASPKNVQSTEDQQRLQRALKAGQVLRCCNLYLGIASPAHGVMRPKWICSSE
jgi:hypothetical protein